MFSTAAALAGAIWLAAAAPAPAGPPRPPDDVRSAAYYSYCLSQQAFLRHEFAEALEHMREAVEEDPGSAELTLDLARLQMDLGRPDEAARVARRAVDLAPDSAEAQRVLADALFVVAMGEHAPPDAMEKAGQAYRRQLELDPSDAGALLNLARVQITRDDLPGALESLRRHVQIAPQSEEGIVTASQVLVRLKRATEARELLESSVQQHPDSARLAFALIDLYESSGDLEAAMAMAKRVQRLRAAPVRIEMVLAQISQRMGRHAEAYGHLEELARLMEVHPADFSEADRAEVQLRKVLALLEAGRVDDALAQAEAGQKRFDTDQRFPLRKGEALLMAGRAPEAEALFRRILESPAAPASERGRPEQQVSDTYLSAGAREEQKGRIQEAEKLLRKSIAWDAGNATALNYLGYMLAERGRRLDEAVDLIRRALERDPNNGAYLDSLGWAYFKKKNYPEAEKTLRTALANLIDEPAIHDHLGDLYHETGRTPEALKAWQEALDRGAENADQIRAKMGKARQGAPSD